VSQSELSLAPSPPTDIQSMNCIRHHNVDGLGCRLPIYQFPKHLSDCYDEVDHYSTFRASFSGDGRTLSFRGFRHFDGLALGPLRLIATVKVANPLEWTGLGLSFTHLLHLKVVPR